MKVAFNSLLNSDTDPTSRVPIQTAARKESDAWIHTLPMSSLGLRMDHDVIRVAIDLRLGNLYVILTFSISVDLGEPARDSSAQRVRVVVQGTWLSWHC